MSDKVSELDQFKTNKEKRDFIISKIENLASLIEDYDGLSKDGDDKLHFLLMCLREGNVASTMVDADDNGLLNMFTILLNKINCHEVMALAFEKGLDEQIASSIALLKQPTPLNPHDID